VPASLCAKTISQYIHLVQDLTNQSTLTRMNDKLIKEILGSEDSLAAFFTFCEQEQTVRDKLMERMGAQLD